MHLLASGSSWSIFTEYNSLYIKQPEQNMKTALVSGLIAALVTAALFTVKQAYTQGTAISVGMQQGTVPRGAVMAFNLERCPFLWRQFGRAGGRVIVGFGAATISGETKVFSPVGQSGGDFYQIISTDQMPSHEHPSIESKSVSTPGTESTVLCTNAPNCTSSPHSHGFSPFDEHEHIGLTGATGSAGGNERFSIIQPYITLLYCQFTGIPIFLDVETEADPQQ